MGNVTTGVEWQAKARQAEDLGFDVLLVADHLGMAAPIPALVSAAGATTDLKMGTFVLNAGFYPPVLLARDVETTCCLTGNRFELGLGTGYNEAEFDAAGLPFLGPGERIQHVATTVGELREQLSPMPPLMLAGNGDRMLRLAAREADIVGISISTLADGEDGERALAHRVDVVRAEAGDRLPDIELNLFVFMVQVTTGAPDLTLSRAIRPDLTDEEILALPNVLVGSAEALAEKLLHYRDVYDLSYFAILEPNMTDFAKVMALLR
jgi:probable F420-dependent oxidoreductase